MTEGQSSYVPFRNGQRNSCDRANQDVAFDLEKYGLYIDKIRAFFVPSLEYRIRSLLEEFVYSTDSRSTRRFPRFKRFVDAMATWKGPLNKIAEYDIGTMEDVIRSIVNCTLKDDLITCFLDSIVLHHRLSKICRELDALGIEDNILRSLNAWNFANERNYWTNRDSQFTDTAANCNMNSSVATRRDAERLAGCEKVVEPLTTSDVYCDGSTEHARPITSGRRVRERRQALDSNRNWQRRDNRHAYGSQRSDADEARDERSRTGESGKTRSVARLKVIVRKMHLEACGCSTLFRPTVGRLSLPCKPSDLLGRIFEADPSLTESCLIVMRRKFRVYVRNVCSCLNDVLGKLNVEMSRRLIARTYLNCEIRPGYISFKLKTDGAGGVCKCLFVARIPICQNVHRPTVPLEFVAASSHSAEPKGEVEESKCSGRCEGDETDFNDTFARNDEENERVGDTCCSCLDQNPPEDTKIDSRMGNNNIKGTALPRSINEDVSERNYKLTTCSHDESSGKIIETVFDATSRTSDSEARNEKDCKALDSCVIDCDKNMMEDGKEILDSDHTIMKNNGSTQSANRTNCACSPGRDSAEMNNEVKDILSCKDSDGLLRTTGLETSHQTDLDKRDWTRSSSKKFDSSCSCTDASSITTFVPNSERDKQMVELNCNRFSDINVAEVDERSTKVDLLDSTRVEIGCNSNCSCCYSDFVDITVIDDVSEENTRVETLQSSRNAICSRRTKISSKDNLFTIFEQTPRLQVSSKGINVDISCSRTTAWLASGDDKSVPSVVKARDRCNEATDSLARPRREGDISHNAAKEVLNTAGRTRGFVRPRSKHAVSKKRSRPNADSRHRVSTQENPHAGDCSPSLAPNVSYTCRSLTTNETRGDKFRKARESLRLRYVRATSSNGARSVTSVTTMKYRTTARRNDYSADGRPQAAYATDRFRKSVGKSVRWIKRLIRSKLPGAFFNQRRAKTTRAFWGSDESAGDIARQRTAGRCVRQEPRFCATGRPILEDYCVTPRSNRRRRGCTISRVESSDVTLPCRRNCGKERTEGGTKLRDRRLTGGSEVLSSFRSIDTTSPPWSYNLLTRASEDLGTQELDGGRRQRLGKEDAEDKLAKQNFSRYDFGNYEKSITISSRSATVSLVDDDSAEHFELCKQRRRAGDDKRNRTRRASGKRQHQAGRRSGERKKPLTPITDTNDDFSELSSTLFVRTDEARDSHRRSHDRSRSASKLSPLRKNRKILDRRMEMDRLRKRRVFALLADTCHDCARDLDLDFESTLTRYVQLCRNVKRSLMRTLRPDNICQVSTTSTPGSDS